MNIRFSPAQPNVISCVVLNREDLERGLIEFYVDLLSDATFVREQLQNKSSVKGIHLDVKSLSEEELLNTYADMCIGERVLAEMAANGYPPVDFVTYRTGPNVKYSDGDFVFLACKEQNLPKEWARSTSKNNKNNEEIKDNNKDTKECEKVSDEPSYTLYVNGKLFNIKGV